MVVEAVSKVAQRSPELFEASLFLGDGATEVRIVADCSKRSQYLSRSLSTFVVVEPICAPAEVEDSPRHCPFIHEPKRGRQVALVHERVDESCLPCELLPIEGDVAFFACGG